MKKRTLFVLDSIVNGADTAEQVEAIDLQILLSHAPKLFMGSESVEVKYDKQFESACLLISQKANMDAKRMTVLQFYNAVDTIKQQAEAEMKGSKLKRRK